MGDGGDVCVNVNSGCPQAEDNPGIREEVPKETAPGLIKRT